MKSTVVRFQQAVAALTGVTLRDLCPLTGKIVQVTMHFPAGCNALVDVAFLHIQRHVVPLQGFVALNDATPSFVADEDVKKNDPLFVIIQNGDILPHTISVMASVIGEEGGK